MKKIENGHTSVKNPSPCKFRRHWTKSCQQQKKLVHTNLPPEITNYDTILFLNQVFPINNSSSYLSVNIIFTFLSCEED